MLENITAKINGENIVGWKSFTLNTSMRNIFSEFSLTLTLSPEVSNLRWYSSDAITIYTNDELIFTGFIDSVNKQEDINGNSCTIKGRSKTAILSDTYFYDISTEIKDIELTTFLDKITEPYDIKYEIIGNRNPRCKVDSLDLMKTAERNLKDGLLSMSAPCAISTKNGGIKIFTTDKNYETRGAIERSLTTSFSVEESKRYNKYIAANSTNDVFSSSNSQEVEVVDDTVKDTRRVIRKSVSGISDIELLTDYAEWMKNTAYAASRSVEIEIVGWRNTIGEIYEVGNRVFLIGENNDRLGCSGEWLINAAEYRFSDQGTTCRLSLVKKEIYISEPRSFENETSDTFSIL